MNKYKKFLLNSLKTIIIVSSIFAVSTTYALAKEIPTAKDKKQQVKEISKAKEEDEEIKNEVIGAKWTETLRLRDIVLSAEAFELSREKLENYRNVLEKNYKEKPDVFSNAVSYGLILIDLNEFDKAKTVWDKAVKDFIANKTPVVYKGWTDACNGQYALAKEAFYPTVDERYKAGVGISTGMWLPYHMYSLLGLYLIKDYFPENEKKDIEEKTIGVAQHFAKRPEYGVILISDDLQKGKLKSAELKLEKLLTANPDEPIVLTLKGIAELLKGNYKDSIAYFDKSSEKFAHTPTNYLMKGRALYALGKKKEAKKIAKEAFKLDPTLAANNKDKKEELLLAKSYLIPAQVEISKEQLKKNKKEEALNELKKINESEKSKEAIAPEKN